MQQTRIQVHTVQAQISVIFCLRLLKSGQSLKLGDLCSAVSSSSRGQISTMNKEKTVSLN